MAGTGELFAQLLTEGIYRIRLKEAKTVSAIQDELGYALGRNGGSVIERWRKGHLPPQLDDVESLARLLVERGDLDRAWLLRFLQSAGYPHPEIFCDALLPPAVPKSEVSQDAGEKGVAKTPWKVPARLGVTFIIGLLLSLTAGLLFSGESSWSGVTASFATYTPDPTFTDLRPFPADRYGILLLSNNDHDTSVEILDFLESGLKARLASSGVSRQVQLVTTAAPADAQLAELRQQVQAQMAAYVVTASDGGALTISLHTDFASEGKDISILQATADALSLPFTSGSTTAASEILADRLAIIANAALGYRALGAGAYGECSRRFMGMLSLEASLNIPVAHHAYGHTALANCLDGLGRLDEARAHYTQAVALDPDFSHAYLGLGNYWYTRRDFERASQLYQEAIVKAEIDPLASDQVTGHAYASLGNITLASEQWTEALKAFSQAIVYDPRHPAYRLARAQVYFALELPVAARQDLEVCIALASPSNQDPSQYQRQVGEECLKAIQASVTVTPTGTSALDSPFLLATLPAPWRHQDIGIVKTAGTATYERETFIVTAYGPAVEPPLATRYKQQALHFVYRPLPDNGTVTARLQTLSSGDHPAQAGLLIREGLREDARMVMVANQSGTTQVLARTVTGGDRMVVNQVDGRVPFWLRLERVGDTIAAFHSENGIQWTLLGTVRVSALARTLLAGLVANAPEGGTAVEASFSEVSLLANSDATPTAVLAVPPTSAINPTRLPTITPTIASPTSPPTAILATAPNTPPPATIPPLPTPTPVAPSPTSTVPPTYPAFTPTSPSPTLTMPPTYPPVTVTAQPP